MTASKKAVQIYDNEGNVFQCSKKSMLGLLYENFKFITLTQLTGKVSMDRFPPSPIYDPTGQGLTKEEVGNNSDVLNASVRKESKQVKQYSEDFIL